MKILAAAGAALALYFLSLSGPNQPAWLFSAVMGLLLAVVVLVGADITATASVSNDPVMPEMDEHRDNAI